MPDPNASSPPPSSDASDVSETDASDTDGDRDEHSSREADASAASSSDASSSDAPDDTSVARHVRILKGGAVMFAVVGLAISGWMIDKWIRFPGQQASQLGSSAPFWPAATIFVLVSTVAGVALLWKASTRAASGEDLYAQRHRKHRKDDPDF